MEQNQNEQMSAKEVYDAKRQEKQESHSKNEQKQTVKGIGKTVLMLGILAGGIGAIIWYFATIPPIPQEDVVSRSGIHVHPILTITKDGEKVVIPANLGIGINHQGIHTHDTTGTLHVEKQGLVRKDDTTLSHFFEIWGKDFMEFGSFVSMTVNGEENTELQSYPMKDGDTIELHYETQK